MSDWIDEGLPVNFALSSADVDGVPVYVDDPVDVGAPRRRARFTRQLRRWPAIVIPWCDRADKAAVLAFHDTTLSKGAISFTFPVYLLDGDVGGASVSVRFTGRPKPTAITADDWTVSFGIELV